jgi:hypothetical protein
MLDIQMGDTLGGINEKTVLSILSGKILMEYGMVI